MGRGGETFPAKGKLWENKCQQESTTPREKPKSLNMSGMCVGEQVRVRLKQFGESVLVTRRRKWKSLCPRALLQLGFRQGSFHSDLKDKRLGMVRGEINRGRLEGKHDGKISGENEAFVKIRLNFSLKLFYFIFF